MRLFFFFAPVAAAVLASCTSSSSTSSGPVDAGPPTFTNLYRTVISRRCAPCHTTATGDGVVFGKLDMTSRATAFANLVNQPTAGDKCAGKGTRVVAHQPDSSIMYLKVSLDDAAPCGAKMPLGGPSLPKEEADLVEAWINA